MKKETKADQIKRLWAGLTKALSFEFVFMYFPNQEVQDFYAYALDKMASVRKELEDEFREKFGGNS